MTRTPHEAVSRPLPASEVAGLRILVVEDQGFERWVIGNMLASMGVQSLTLCGDGSEALERLAADPYDIVICDLDMPHMDGMEFMRHVAAAHSGISLAMCTGMNKPLVTSVEAMALAYGVRLLGTIPKPPTAAKLAAVIAEHGRPRPEKAPAAASRRYSLGEIEGAIARGEIQAHFQPKVRMSDRGLVSAEALARWRHPEDGIVMPGAFIGPLEAAGRIDALTEKMLECALGACRAWRDGGIDVTVALNLSLQSLSDLRIADRIFARVEFYGLRPESVVLELTESTEAVNLGHSLENLSRLRMRGFGLSIDDFGTGYSSMLQLARVPFTELKIDRGFVRNALQTPSHRTLLESSLDVARRLGITAVAEGVETAAEWALLESLECPVAQGYFISRPRTETDFHQWAIAGGR